ncbi:SurA N-terminal domain-containing protein [Streptomyces sp. NPDC002054]|uniref:SurA N-terminal domain-containing protein n=1 Tax=Streptomyces sp. NPDC002054 TaxID=3154663 RepID=UPI0033336E0D
MHRRTALSVSAALLLAAPLLSACSGEARPGTAAVVGGERITTSALQAQVKDVRDAQQRSANATQLVANSTQLERVKLSKMIQLRVLEKAAATAGITVSTKETEEVQKSRLAQTGGQEKMDEIMLAQRVPLAPGQVEDEVRFQLLFAKLSDRYGEDKVLEPLAKAAEQLRIEVNPRYGAWDTRQITVGDQKIPWISQKTRPEQPPAGA